MPDSEGVVCYEFRKNAKEVVRATCQDFEGRSVLDLRSFMPKADGTLCPTPRGITIQRSQLSELEAAVSAFRSAINNELSNGNVR